MQMGMTKREAERILMGEYVDMFSSYKQVFNMKAEGMKYKLPEKKTSMLDL